MRVFVTGASGFIGSAVTKELINNGHQVLGLARSAESAAAIRAAGGEVQQGSLDDLDSLRKGAAAADAVIHTAFIHDFSKFAENCEIDRRAIEALGDALAGTGRPLIVSAGTGSREQGRIATEDTKPVSHPGMPRVSEEVTLAQVAKGVRASVVRLPQVHDVYKQGLVTYLIAQSRQTGVSAYIGEGLNRWAAVHVLDAARLYRLVLEKGKADTCYHAVGEEGITLREIAETVGKVLDIPVVSKSNEEAPGYFGLMAWFAGMSNPTSSALTQEWLGWHPAGPGLIADLEKGLF